MCESVGTRTSSPGRVRVRSATWFAIVPLGRNSDASMPNRLATSSWSRLTDGSSPYWSSPTSASAIARRMPSTGRVTVSERRSIRSGMASMIGSRLRRSEGSDRSDADRGRWSTEATRSLDEEADGASRSQSSAASRSSTQNGLPRTATFGPDTIFIGREARSIPVQISTRGSLSIACRRRAGSSISWVPSMTRASGR